MTENEAKDRAVFIINKLEEEGSNVIPHYLVLYVIGLELFKSGKDIPIDGIDPITMSLVKEIERLSPGLSGSDFMDVRSAVCKYLQENNYADHYFDRKET